MKILRYVHKPMFVDAVQVSRDNIEEVAKWCNGFVTEGMKHNKAVESKCIKVEVLRPQNPRQTLAFYGDWVLKMESGWKVYTTKAFHDTFDNVPEATEPVEAKELLEAALVKTFPR